MPLIALAFCSRIRTSGKDSVVLGYISTRAQNIGNRPLISSRYYRNFRIRRNEPETKLRSDGWGFFRLVCGGCVYRELLFCSLPTVLAIKKKEVYLRRGTRHCTLERSVNKNKKDKRCFGDGSSKIFATVACKTKNLINIARVKNSNCL